jgi:hypothetical protein
MMEENGCLMNKANHGVFGEKKYLVSAVWWRQWCDYVNFDNLFREAELAPSKPMLSPMEVP